MNINTTHLSVDGPEIKDNASEWEEKRNAFDFMENL